MSGNYGSMFSLGTRYILRAIDIKRVEKGSTKRPFPIFRSDPIAMGNLEEKE